MKQLKKKQPLHLKRITDVKLGLRPKPDRSCTSLRFSAGLRPLFLRLTPPPLLSCWDAFILQPFSLLWPLMSNMLQLKRRLKPLLAPLLCWTPQQTSGLLFCCPISSHILGGTKENRRLTVQKVTLHHVAHSQPDTETMRRRWKAQRCKGAGLVGGGGGGRETEVIPPWGSFVSPQLPVRHQRLQRGQIVEEWGETTAA